MAQEPGTRHFMVLQEASSVGQAGARVSASRSIADVAVDMMRKAGYTAVDGTVQRINGNEAYVGVYRGSAKDVGQVTMRAAHIAVGRQIYVVAGFAPDADFALTDREFGPAVQSFRQLSSREASAIRPNRLKFYTVKAGDTALVLRHGGGIELDDVGLGGRRGGQAAAGEAGQGKRLAQLQGLQRHAELHGWGLGPVPTLLPGVGAGVGNTGGTSGRGYQGGPPSGVVIPHELGGRLSRLGGSRRPRPRAPKCRFRSNTTAQESTRCRAVR